MPEKEVLDIGQFDVMVTDHPWCYQNWTDAAHGSSKSAMIVQDERALRRLPLHTLLKKDSILLAWLTWPKLMEGECHRVIRRSAGVKGVTAAPWIKTTPKSKPEQIDISTGIGFWFQSASEILSVWRKGSPSTKRFPILGLLTGDERQFYYPASRKHSQKPEDIYEWIEKKCGPPGDGSNGTTRYLEIFATRRRPGWICVGERLGTWISERGITEMDPCTTAGCAGFAPPELTICMDCAKAESAKNRDSGLA